MTTQCVGSSRFGDRNAAHDSISSLVQFTTEHKRTRGTHTQHTHSRAYFGYCFATTIFFRFHNKPDHARTHRQSTRTHTNTNALSHTYTQTHTHTDTHTHTHTHTHTPFVCSCHSNNFLSRPVHTAHTHTHTRTHTHTHTRTVATTTRPSHPVLTAHVQRGVRSMDQLVAFPLPRWVPRSGGRAISSVGRYCTARGGLVTCRIRGGRRAVNKSRR